MIQGRIAKKSPRGTFAQCAWCSKPNKNIKEIRYTKGRAVIFCDRNCFVQYIFENQTRRHSSEAEVIKERLDARLAELKEESYFSNPNDVSTLVKEAIIFEFMFVEEGHEVVTIRERHPPIKVVE
jgi:hypothetical protein